MKNNFLILLFFFSFPIYSQVYFHNTYDNAIACRNIIEVDSGYIVAGGSKVNLRTYLNISYIDSFGMLQISKNYGDSLHFYYHGLSNSLKKTVDGGYVLAGSKVRISDEAGGVFLIRFDENLDTLWSKCFLMDTFPSAAYQCQQTSDSGFIIIGARDLNAVPHLEILLIKTDSQGNLQWSKQYSHPTFDKTGTRILLTPDGGYLIGGWIGDNSKSGSGDWYIMKVDSLGNFQWDRSYGSEVYDDNEVISMCQTKDSCFLLAGAIVKSETSGQRYYRGRIIKIDSEGETIWDKEYDETSQGTTFQCIIETEDENIIVVGNCYDIDYDASFFKLYSNGDTIWRRTYDYGLYDDGSLGYMKSVIETRDNGFAIAGFGMFSDLVPSQQMWVIKTDSCGYDVPGFSCGGTEVLEVMVNENDWVLYPNPATNHFRCMMSKVIPIAIGSQMCVVQIYDVQGKKRVEIRDFDLEGEIDVSGLENGMYLVKITCQDKVFNERIVVQH